MSSVVKPSTAQRISHYARFPPTALSLAQMAQFGQTPSTATVYRAAQFMADELPVRLAHRVRELENLPEGLGESPSIQRVLGWYVKSFEDIVDMQQYAQERLPDTVRANLLQVSSESLSMPAKQFNDNVKDDYIKPTLKTLKALEDGSNPNDHINEHHNEAHHKSFFGSLKDRLFSGFGEALSQSSMETKMATRGS